MATNGDHLRRAPYGAPFTFYPEGLPDFPITHDMSLSEMSAHMLKQEGKPPTANVDVHLAALRHATSPMGKARTEFRAWASWAAISFCLYMGLAYGWAHMVAAFCIGAIACSVYYGAKYLILKCVAFLGDDDTSNAAAPEGTPPTT